MSVNVVDAKQQETLEGHETLRVLATGRPMDYIP